MKKALQYFFVAVVVFIFLAAVALSVVGLANAVLFPAPAPVTESQALKVLELPEGTPKDLIRAHALAIQQLRQLSLEEGVNVAWLVHSYGGATNLAHWHLRCGLFYNFARTNETAGMTEARAQELREYLSGLGAGK